MDIGQACKTVRLWADPVSRGATGPTHPGDLIGAVAVLKRYLEQARGDGKPVRSLEIAEPLLATRERIRAVMPFVLIAEALQAGDDGASQADADKASAR